MRAGFDPRPSGPDSWESRCPAHDGDRRNLSIKRGDDGRALIHCHAHDCEARDIVAALGIDRGGPVPDPRRPPHEAPRQRQGRAEAQADPPDARGRHRGDRPQAGQAHGGMELSTRPTGPRPRGSIASTRRTGGRNSGPSTRPPRGGRWAIRPDSGRSTACPTWPPPAGSI